MNINNTQPPLIPITRPQAESKVNRLDTDIANKQSAPLDNTTFVDQNSRKPNLFRINRVANQIEDYDSRSKPQSLDRAISNQPPINQYQSNQLILQRNAIAELVGVDLLA